MHTSSGKLCSTFGSSVSSGTGKFIRSEASALSLRKILNPETSSGPTAILSNSGMSKSFRVFSPWKEYLLRLIWINILVLYSIH